MGWARRRYGNPDQNQQGIVDLVRDMPASVVNTTALGDGAPDLLVGFQQLTIGVELKRPVYSRGRRQPPQLRPSQEDFMNRWRGGPILVADDGMDLVQQLVRLDRKIPPVRGMGRSGGTAQAILADCLAAAAGLIVDEDDLPGLIRQLRLQKGA